MYNDHQSHGILNSFKNLFGSRKESDTDTHHGVYTMLQELSPSSVSIEESIVRPMSTRTVDYSHVEQVVTPREEIATAPQIEVATGELLHPEYPDMDVDFATHFVAKGGKFVYCETLLEAVDYLRELSIAHGWHHIFEWENEIKDVFQNYDFQRGAIGYTLENSDAAICLCEALIADSGNVILNPKQASRRRLPVFPDAHILLADLSRLSVDLNKALDKFSMKNKSEVPSVLDLHNNVKGCYYHDGNLVLKSEGTNNVYLILVDERIMPSTRP